MAKAKKQTESSKKFTLKPKSSRPGVHSKNNKPDKKYRGQGK